MKILYVDTTMTIKEVMVEGFTETLENKTCMTYLGKKLKSVKSKTSFIRQCH